MYAITAFAKAVNANELHSALLHAIDALRNIGEFSDAMVAAGFDSYQEECEDKVGVLGAIAGVTISDELYAAINRAV